MMDESRVIPKGSHFGRPDGHDGGFVNLTWRHRCSVAPVDYYYIDFGLSGWYPRGKKTAARRGVVGQVKTVPELSDTVPYNPFEVDIYQLGHTILQVIEVRFMVVAMAMYSCILLLTGVPRSSYVCASWPTYDTSEPGTTSNCICRVGRIRVHCIVD
jgi:hypothetical protein